MAEVCVTITASRQYSHSTDTVSSSQQPAAVPVEKNDQSSQSTVTTDMTDMATLQIDGACTDNILLTAKLPTTTV